MLSRRENTVALSFYLSKLTVISSATRLSLLLIILRFSKAEEERKLLTMSPINNTRNLTRMGYIISKISFLTGVSRKTVREYLRQDNFSPHRRSTHTFILTHTRMLALLR
jgi:hypothetical protein